MTPSNDGPSYTPKPDWSPRAAKGQKGFVNPAVFPGSTALDPTAGDLHVQRAEFATASRLSDHACAAGRDVGGRPAMRRRGMAAIAATLLSVLRAGDHVL
jgi:cystathionine beta-lyase